MALAVSEVQLIGPAAVSIASVDMGHTDEEGAKVALTNEIVEAMAGKYGQTPVKKWLNGQRVEVEFNLIQTNFTNLASVLPGATKVTSGADSKLTFGKNAGTPLTGVALKLTSHITAQTPAYDFTIAQAVPIGDFELVYSGEGFNKWACKFEGLIDEGGGADGSWLATFGDTSISADAVAPTATVVPADDAAAVAVGTAVVWTVSENLNGNTVDAFSVYLLEDAETAGAGAKVAGTVVLVNNGASTTITFTPDSDLTAATPFVAVLTDAIEDLAGNSIVMMITNFTTA